MTDSGGKRLIAEWEPQWAILIVWPHDDTDWRSSLGAAQDVYRQLARAISGRQTLIIACRDTEHEQDIRRQLHASCDLHRCRFYHVQYDDTWCRDYGPLSVCAGQEPRRQLVNFAFNGWGERHDHLRDNAVTELLHRAGAFGNRPMRRETAVLEGGSIDGDGNGTVITSSSCLLAQNRNGTVDRQWVERVLRNAVGTERIFWLDHGSIPGDDTDGHVDMLARFCDPYTLAYAQGASEPLREMERQLGDLRRADGPPYKLVPLPLPDRSDSESPASYANFSIINRAVLVPVYGQPQDDIAISRLRQCFPGREVVPVDCGALIKQGGAVHCATMQLH